MSVSGGGSVSNAAQRVAPLSYPSWNAPTRSKALPCAFVVGRVAAGRVAQREVAGEAGVEIALVQAQGLRLAVGQMAHPRTGEAVGLLLLGDGGPGDAGLVLDRVAPLVGQRQRDGEVAELVREVREQLLVVVRDVLAEAAVERVHRDVGVRGALGPALRDLGLRRVGDHLGGRDRHVVDAVDRGQLLGPPLLQVVHRELDRGLVLRGRGRGGTRRHRAHGSGADGEGAGGGDQRREQARRRCGDGARVRLLSRRAAGRRARRATARSSTSPTPGA